VASTLACSAPPDEIVIADDALGHDTIVGCTQIAFGNGHDVVTAGSRLYYRAGEEFRASLLAGLNDAHSVAYNPRDQLFYVADSGNGRLVACRDPSRNEIAKSTGKLAGVQLDRPHDIVCDATTGWLYALNPNRVTLFRFKGFGEDESALDLSENLGYSRSLTLADGKLFVVGSSAGKVLEVTDFEHHLFHAYNSFGKRRDAPAGSWKTTGLVPNDVDFFDGYWYVTSYFCPSYAGGEDSNENKFIRFRTWRDFETGNWEDLSDHLPKNIVPYYLTPRDDALFLAAFYHEGKDTPGKVFKITTRRN
jgi:hypothetical protein